jgi:DNA topoisomerase-3
VITLKLVVCEKPSQSQSIAAVLGAKQRQDGFLQGNGWLVSWCFGHLVEPAQADAYGERYRRWNRGALPILPENWKYRIAKDKSKQLAVLCGLMNRADVDCVINACDAGREGELICRLVYEYAKSNKPIKRLWISSMEDAAIREGFEKLRPGADYDGLYRSALCRSRADWLVGINATRLFSCLYGGTLNVGRVQSPTLAMIVDREKAAAGFVPEPFYTPAIGCGLFSASGERQSDPDAAARIRDAADGKDAVVLSVEKVKKTAAPPKLYDLTTLQREANRLFGFTAQQTLDYIQSLYEKKLASYPRTDAKYITADMRDTVLKIIGDTNFAPDIDRTIGAVSDHHAIIPTLESRSADLSALPAGERSVLQMITARLICAVSPVHKYETVTAVLECGGGKFTAKGRTVLDNGWKAADSAFRAALKSKPDDSEDEEAAMPDLTAGQIFPSVRASVREGKTAPPRRYTEDTLLAAMECAGVEDMPADGLRPAGGLRPEDAERKGLGTPATRAGIIEKLIKSGLAERQKKNIIPTEKGKNLTAILPDAIKSPLLTAEWEQKLKQVERGELDGKSFMDGISGMLRKLVGDHTAPLPEYAKIFADSAQNNTVTNRYAIIGECPRCRSGVVEKRKGFFCSGKGCSFMLWKDSRFFEAKKKKLTKAVAAALLKEGRVFFSDLYSEKTGKTYAAAVLLDDTGDRVNYKLDFSGRKNK